MKKLIICALCFVSYHGFAQFRLGVQGSFSSLNFWQTDGYSGLPTQLQTNAINGFQAGLVAEYDLGYTGLVLQPALMYAENGSHLVNVQGFVDPPNEVIGVSNTTLKIYSIRLPINLLYRIEANKNLRFFVGFGPYIAKNVAGTEKGYYQGYDNPAGADLPFTKPIDNKAKISSDPSSATQGVTNIASFDFGVDGLIGASYKKWELSASWNRGFSRLYHTTYANTGNVFWNFTLAYMIFGHNRKPQL
jgi:hypothetical protein